MTVIVVQAFVYIVITNNNAIYFEREYETVTLMYDATVNGSWFFKYLLNSLCRVYYNKTGSRGDIA